MQLQKSPTQNSQVTPQNSQHSPRYTAQAYNLYQQEPRCYRFGEIECVWDDGKSEALSKLLEIWAITSFRRQIEYKSQLYGSQVVFVDRFFPSSKTANRPAVAQQVASGGFACSNCDVVKESLPLTERTFKCDKCGFTCDRDLNASINLEKAVSSTVSACGLGSADTSSDVAGRKESWL